MFLPGHGYPIRLVRSLIVRGKLSEYQDTYIGQLHLPIIAVEEARSTAEVISASKGSKRNLAYAHFAIGIDQLTQGHRQLAAESFQDCIREGPPVFYVVHLSYAILERWKADPSWPDWLPTNQDP